MSSVTDLVMILPALRQASDRWVWKGPEGLRTQFEDLFEQFHDYRPRPVEVSPTPGKGWYADVYLIGVNYLNWDFPDAMEKLEWPPGTTLYLCHENGSPMVLQLGENSGSRYLDQGQACGERPGPGQLHEMPCRCYGHSSPGREGNGRDVGPGN